MDTNKANKMKEWSRGIPFIITAPWNTQVIQSTESIGKVTSYFKETQRKIFTAV